MQEQKLLKKKRKAECDGNKKGIASACIDLAELYNNQERFEDAIKEYEIVAEIYKQMGTVLDYARANRGIGEAYIQLREYDKALEYQQIYLGIAKEKKNKLEEQRALATIGHIHLSCYLDNPDRSNLNILNLAYKAFKKSLVICESLTDVQKHEHKDMNARLLANLGLVEECKGDHDKAIQLLQKSIEICKSYDLFEQLNRGYTALGTLYGHKQLYDEAIRQFNLAYDVAGRLKNKITLQCSALCAKGDVLIKLADFHSAKNILLKAYKLKDPNSSSVQVIEQNLKVVAAMCKAEDALLTTGNSNYKTKKSLYEKLGDGACQLKNFPTAIEYYHKMLEAANANNESGLALSPCYISLAETYRDNSQFDMAIKYFREDYDIFRNNPRDRITTLINIADCMESGSDSLSNIESTYEKALGICKAVADKQMEYKVLTRYIPILKKLKKINRASIMEQRLKETGYNTEGSESEVSQDPTVPNIGDDISINDITDVSGDSDAENRYLRKRTKAFAVKKNNKGESQLHRACINGKYELVKHLLDRGHPVNVRDNCGWLPIHEACISGHLEIVKMLLAKGALINDRGGTLCEGITPLHDAAINGHLDIIQLLLDKGASSISKNDLGEIPLQLLKKWRKSQDLTNDELILYDILIKRLTVDAEKLGLSLDESTSTDTSAIVSEESEPFAKTSFQRRTRVGNLRRVISCDEDVAIVRSSASRQEAETPAQNEYKRAMENLRHSTRDEIEKKRKSNDKVSAHTEHDSDDWLDDDMGLMSKKRKTNVTDAIINSTRMRRSQSSSSTLKSLVVDDDDIDIPSEFFEADFNVVIEDDDNTSVSSSASTTILTKSKKKRQTSLIDSGFTRQRSFSPTNSIHSRSPNKRNSLSRNETIDRRQSNTSINLDMNSIFNTEPMLSVDVRISGRLYKVPVPASEIHIRTIKWLADEAAKRYSRKECMKPDLELETKNGAILADEDLISVLFSAGITHAEEVEARITKCNILPLVERYSEACTLENITPSKELLKLLGETSTTLNLSDLNLKSTNIAPLCRVINRQLNLSCLNLSGNFIHDNCFRLLCASLPMLDNLTELNVSLNQLTSASLQSFSEIFIQSPTTILPNLINLDLSYNPLENKSLTYLAIITRYLKLKTLHLVSVSFTANFETNVDLVLDSLTNFDISFNQINNRDVMLFLWWLKPQIVETLNVSSNKETTEGLIKDMIEWFVPLPDTKLALKTLNLARTRATDGEVFELLRVLSASPNFKHLDLRYNSNITSLSLRRLVQHHPSFDRLILIGCENIFKYFNDCTDNTWSCLQFKELELSCDFDKYFTEKNCIVDIWKNVYRHKAIVIEVPNFVKLSITD